MTLLLVASVYRKMSSPSAVLRPLSRPLSGAPFASVKDMSVTVPVTLNVKALVPVLLPL
ncbi:hypothetical protein D3C86_1379960 [compost metagenome]